MHRCNLSFRVRWIWSRVLSNICGAVACRKDTQLCSWRARPSITSPLLLQEECQNYMRVLIVTGRKVFMCGTNAFSPVCSSRQVRAVRRPADRGGHQEVPSLRHTAWEWGCQFNTKTKTKRMPS